MFLTKPNWYSGRWSADKQVKLIAELIEAKMLRSLTNEEQDWINRVKGT
jgi:hypothetical protein